MEHELEFIERRMYEDMHAAADDGLRARLKLGGFHVGSAFASVAGALPASAIVMNITYGLGLEEQATPEQVAEIVEHYKLAGAQRYFIQLHPQARPKQLPDWLADRNLLPARGWMMFERGREAPASCTCSLKIREAAPSDALAFARIVADAFDLGEMSMPWLAKLIGRPGWHIYMSFESGEPAGTGAMYVEDDLAYLTFGATAPAYRGRGGQSALLRDRIGVALDLGCRVLATCTGEEVPGDPQHSYNNILKAGFKEGYVRRNYALPRHS